jgi:hypothetical protein
MTAIQAQAQPRMSAPPEGADRIINCYPNPATSFISFDFKKDYDKGYNLQVYNFVGKIVFEQKSIPPKTTINLGDYNRGVYIYYLVDRNGKIVESGKFQVAK